MDELMTIPEEFQNFITAIEKLLDIDKNTAKDAIAKLIAISYAAQWPENCWCDNKTQDMLIGFAKDKLFKGNKLDESAVTKVIASISLFCYACTENFNKFMVFNKVNGEYICLECGVPSRINGDLLENAFKLFDGGKLQIHRLQSIGDSVYGKGIQFSIK